MSVISTNRDFKFLHHEDIIEYDIRSANTSLMSYYKLASEEEIAKLVAMKKDEREIAVGKMMRKSKSFANALEKAFSDIIEEFLSSNDLDQTEDVISIKKDAVFVRNRSIKKMRFGSSVSFIPKGRYTGFLQLPKNHLEFYYRTDNGIDVKGISDNLLQYHTDGMLDFISSLFRESSQWGELQRYLKEYAREYKRRNLPFNAYRNFDMNSKFLVHMLGQDVLMDHIDDTLMDYVDISYNYVNIFMEVLKIVIGR